MGGKCKYYDECPSKTGWCMNDHPSAECVPFLINAANNAIRKKNLLLNELKNLLELIQL